MARKLSKLLLATALIVAVGGHWAVLQSVAWVNMVVTYSQDTSFSLAFQKTFDGKHPCRMCLAVKQGKQEEQKQAVLKVETKLDFLCLQPAAYVHPVLPSTLLSPQADAAFPRAEAPPLPPPRLA